MRRVCVLPLLLIMLVTSCRKDTPVPNTGGGGLSFRHCPSEMLGCCIFKPGSYWTYKDSATGKTRTVTVTDLQHDTSTAYYIDNSTQRGDEYTMTCYDTYDISYLTYYIPLAYNSTGWNKPYQWGYIFSRDTYPGYYSGESWSFVYPTPFGKSYLKLRPG